MSKPAYIVYPAKIANHILREQDKEIERLHSIIKEAKEYCNNRIQYFIEMRDINLFLIVMKNILLKIF